MMLSTARNRRWRPARRALQAGFSLLPLFLSMSVAFGGLDPAKAMTQYTSDIWRSGDGLPQDSIKAIVQSSDGYLWLGTQEGLARFDGVRFTVFDTANTPELPSNSINCLCEALDGSLWAGTSSGLIRYREGAFASYTTRQGLSNNVVESILCSEGGEVWIGTGGGGVNRFQDGRFEAVGEPSESSEIVVWLDQDGDELWYGTQGGAVHIWQQGSETPSPGRKLLVGDILRSGIVSEDGSLWNGTRNGVYRSGRQRQRLQHIPVEEGEGTNLLNVIYEDRQGTIWLGTRGGLLRHRDGKYELFSSRHGLCNDNVMSIYEDREGSLWIGTRDGLHRLKDGPVTSFTTLEGLSHDLVWTVLEGNDGSLWVATGGGGINRLRNGEVTRYDRSDGLSSDFVWTMISDQQGRIWAGTSGQGVFRLQGDRFQAVLPQDFEGDHVWILYEDRQGVLWVGTEGNGLKRLQGSRVDHFTIADGLPSNRVWAILQDRRGDLWIGTGGGGLARYSGGRFEVFDHRHGLKSSQVHALFEDSQGILWASTNGGGISRIRDGRIVSLGAAEGLFSDVIFHILEDDRASFWMSSAKGIFRIPRRALMARLDGAGSALPFKRFGRSDGLKAYPYAGAAPAACKTRDGRLWFATQKGVASIDPARISANTLPPPVLVEQILVDDQVHSAPGLRTEPLLLDPGAETVEVRFTALSLRDPQRVLFRHRLHPLEQDWSKPHSRRAISYPRIPPGEYTFQVLAANEDGVWSESAAALSFVLQPYFHQTRIFQAACALVLLIGLWAGIRSRFGRLEERNVTLRKEVEDRRRAEDALRRSERRFRGYFQMPLFGFAITSPDQRFLEANDKLCETLGYTREEFQQMSWADLIHAEDASAFHDSRQRIADGSSGSHFLEVRCTRKDDQVIYARLSSACVRRQDGTIDHFVDVVQDLTESKHLEEQLRDSRKMEAIGRLAGGVAHDFNNILTVISGYGQLLQGAVNGNGRLGRQVESILDAAQKAETLTRQLLAFSRRQVLDPRVLDLNDVIGDMKGLLKSLLGEGVRLTTRLASRLDPVRVDAGQIQQVLMNLAVNARDAMTQRGRFSISTRNVELRRDEVHPLVRVPAGSYVLITVKDSGRGMSTETRERAFEPFYTTKAEGQGTGLGLATVYGVIKQSEGYIFIESRPGEGTAFKIYLPAVDRARLAEQEPAPRQEDSRGRETILVVEDDDGIRGLIGTVLQKSGYKYLGAENGTAALNVAERHTGHIDLLLTDVVMPGMNGKELARRMTASMPELRVIFMSGYTEDAIDRHGVLEPGTHFVQKPFTPTSLATTIRRILDEPA